MKLLRKIVCGLLMTITLVTGLQFTLAQDFPYNLENEAQWSSIDIASDVITPDLVDSDKSTLSRLLETFGLTTRAYSQTNDKATAYVRVVINYFLSIASFVALVVVIYGFYMMFFSEQEAGFAKAKKILTGAFIALAIIALSWFIVSFLFGVFQNVSEGDVTPSSNAVATDE